MVGRVPVTVMFSPGHTLASITYVAGDAAFVHDTLMMPDSGSSRADFPGGSSNALFDSIATILSLPEEIRIFRRPRLCAGARGAVRGDRGAASRRETSIGRTNLQRATYRAVRDARDATLPLPKLMLAALQVNISGGRLPAPEGNGRSYLKIPLNHFERR